MSLQQSSMASARDSAIPSTSSAMAIMPCMGHGAATPCTAANPCRGSSRHRTRASKRRIAGFYGAQTDCACLIGEPAQTRHRRLFSESQSVLGGQRGHCCTCAVGGSGRRPAVTPSANTRCNWSCHCRNGGVAGSDAHVACGGVGSLQRAAGRVHNLWPACPSCRLAWQQVLQKMPQPLDGRCVRRLWLPTLRRFPVRLGLRMPSARRRQRSRRWCGEFSWWCSVNEYESRLMRRQGGGS